MVGEQGRGFGLGSVHVAEELYLNRDSVDRKSAAASIKPPSLVAQEGAQRLSLTTLSPALAWGAETPTLLPANLPRLQTILLPHAPARLSPASQENFPPLLPFSPAALEAHSTELIPPLS